MKSRINEVVSFYDTESPVVDSNYTCLAVISLDSALKKGDNCYWQVFLKERKYIQKKVIWRIDDNVSGFSSDESDEE